MASSFLLAVIAVTLVVLQVSDGAKWNYAKGSAIGPENWYKNTDANYKACKRHHQSPIDIDDSIVEHDAALTPFNLKGYDNDAVVQGKNYTLINNGHSIQIELTGDYGISGGNLPGDYSAVQFHFHWGQNDQRGSEHLINGQAFPMEMHIVHYNTEYKLMDSLESPSGLAVLGWFFKITDEDNPGYKWITDYFSDIEYAESSVEIPAFPISQLIPKLKNGNTFDDYFRYDGSLTTPPCYESVVWTVFQEPIMISKKQQDKLRQFLVTKSGETKEFMVDNHRPTQPMKGRKVTSSDKLKHAPKTCGVASPQISLLLAGTVAVIKSLFF